MDKLVIKKSPALNGTVRISGAKNAALPLLMTSLLTDSPCRYANVPRLRDINTTTALLRELGVEVALPAPNDIKKSFHGGAKGRGWRRDISINDK